MSSIIKSLLLTILLLAISSPNKVNAKRKKNYSIYGMWNCKVKKKTKILALHKKGIIVFDNKASKFKLNNKNNKKSGQLNLKIQSKWVPLKYKFGKSKKIKNSKSRRRRITVSIGKYKMQCRSLGKNEEWRIKGMGCSYHGSSSTNSSFSRTYRVLFDGKGLFKYTREVYSSGSAGSYFNKSKAKFGMYRIEGNRVYIAFADGGTGVAKVIKTKGKYVLSLNYQGILLSNSLCN